MVSYYFAVKADPVETEEELNAGHCVDPERDMQLWADAMGIADVINANIISDFVFFCFLFILRSVLGIEDCELGTDPKLEDSITLGYQHPLRSYSENRVGFLVHDAFAQSTIALPC